PGGMLRYGIPEHRLDDAFLDREIRDVTDLGVELRCGAPVLDVDALFAGGFDAVYVATGAWEGLRLETPHRPAQGLLDGLGFLKSAREDRAAAAARVAGRQVVVVGGGDTAMDASLTAARLGASDVYVLYRRSFAQMPGDASEKLAALEAGVHLVFLTQPVDYVSDGDRLTGVRAVRTRLGPPDASGRRAPVPVPGSEHTWDADLVLEAVGQRPAAGLRGLPEDAGGRIVVRDAAGATARPGVWAGGDAVRGPALVARAIGDGKAAARAIGERLVGGR
ncbi:MAG: FAD-dependent oxidoreductase, partial [Deltaproteobacteria bacterium]|nr:FAD-dependent oxidoreductase [Deltaproteobacteria bacterium]